MAAAPSATLPVLINRSGGTAAALGDRLEATVWEAFAPSGRAIALELLDGDEMADAVRRHLDASAIAVGGGDGTLGGAAQLLTGTRTALAILPLGTRNHLARALGIPMGLAEAAAIAATGERRRMDLGRAGGRIFVNNASIGLYPRLVKERDKHELPKWLGTIPAAWQVLKTMRSQHYLMTIDGQARRIRTPLLFVGNNRYSLDFGSLGERETLGDGELSICAVRADGPLHLLKFAGKVLLGLADPNADFAELGEARSIVIESAGDQCGEIGVALDGEVMKMALPLALDILPSALGVVAPRMPVGREPAFFRTHS
ncbi:MAG: diacylglycerol kinase family protein [Novosphingobium sp.]